jgi:uncharacterized membrane protein
MAGAKIAWTDELLERLIGRLLRVGVIAAALMVVAGAILHLARHGHEPPPDRHTFSRIAAEYRRPVLMFRAACAGSGRALIQLGVLLLIATPIARVALSACFFARQRDRTYLVITSLVLAILLLSFAFGRAD